jgi:DNA polymerase (family 10)
VAAEVTRRLTFAAESGARFEVIPVGSVRRLAAGAARARSPRVKDVDFLVVAPASALGAPALAAAGLRPPRAGDCVRVVDTYASGARRRSLVLRIDRAGAAVHLRADLFLATDEERPFALFHYTGPAQYNIRTRAHAKRRGWRLNQYGVFHRATGRRVRGAAALRTERELALFLGVTYRPPEQRT